MAYFNPDTAAMQAEVNKWALVVTGLGVVCVIFYAVQHYGFAVVGERLITKVRRMMLTGERCGN